jgi:hypothetical protein
MDSSARKPSFSNVSGGQRAVGSMEMTYAARNAGTDEEGNFQGGEFSV